MPSMNRRSPRNEAQRVRISVRAKPKASKSRLTRVDGLSVEVALAAAPVDGAANSALIALLASVLHVPKSAIDLVVGATSKQKLLDVSGLDADELRSRLEQALRPRSEHRPPATLAPTSHLRHAVSSPIDPEDH
jgi:uncharacterized protein YggU (UPF0235/DUF167 family)